MKYDVTIKVSLSGPPGHKSRIRKQIEAMLADQIGEGAFLIAVGDDSFIGQDSAVKMEVKENK